MGTTAVVGAIRAAERRLVRRLHGVGARTPETAQPLPDLPHLQARCLEHLKDVGAIREAGAGRCYLEDEAYPAYRGDRRAVASGIALAALGAALAFAFTTRG